jgi:hypothetical protein
LPSTIASDSPSSQWSKIYSGAGNFFATSITQSSGGYIIAGTTTTSDYNPSYAGVFDGFLLKIDSEGNFQWNKTVDRSTGDHIASIIQTSDGGYALAGWTESTGHNVDGWLVKVDEAGEVEWDATFGGDRTDSFQSIVQTSDGSYVLAGTTASGDTNFGSWQNDFWIVKTDSSGNIQWNKTFGETSTDDRCYSLIQTSDGGFALAGITNFAAVKGGDAWLVKTDSEGSIIWNTTWGGTRDSTAQKLLQTSDRGFLVVGKTYSDITYSQDGFLLKINADGQLEWDKVYGDKTDYEGFSSIVPDSDGGYVIAGTSNYRGWLVKVSLTGDLHLNSIFNGLWYVSYFNSVVQAYDGDYIVVGTTRGERLGENQYTTVAWVVKTDGTPKDAPMPTPTTPSQTSIPPTATQNNPPTPSNESNQFRIDFNWIVAALALLSVVVVVLAVAMLYMRRRIHVLENKVENTEK